MVKDGVALTRFFYWLENKLGREDITELSASEKLRSFRADQDNFMGNSFATIAGYREHGAIIHYEPTEESNVALEQEGIFLLDSGGQYLDGTTDITRTITLGNPTSEQKKHFTLVLKGTIQLAMTRFPQGTKGYRLRPSQERHSGITD
jgi:Xaa-Pro aminopeptidase